jgi:glycerol-3-phosphate acyltransferase PlsY
MMISIPFFVFLVLAFLTGYVSFAHIFVKQLREADIRQHGNSGATNASPLVSFGDRIRNKSAIWFRGQDMEQKRNLVSCP